MLVFFSFDYWEVRTSWRAQRNPWTTRMQRTWPSRGTATRQRHERIKAALPKRLRHRVVDNVDLDAVGAVIPSGAEAATSAAKLALQQHHNGSYLARPPTFRPWTICTNS